MRAYFTNRCGTGSRIAPLILLPVLLLLLSSACQRRTQQEAAAGPQLEREFAERTAEPETSPDNGAPLAATDADLQQPPEARTPRFVLSAGELRRWVPYDSEIGELPDRAADSVARAAVRSRTESLFDGLAELEGTINSHVLESQRRRLQRMLADDLNGRDQTLQLRFGQVRWVDSSEATVVVRLITRTGRAAGDIMLENRGDGWYISDVLLDLGLLRDAYQRRTQRVEPWIDRSPLVGP